MQTTMIRESFPVFPTMDLYEVLRCATLSKTYQAFFLADCSWHAIAISFGLGDLPNYQAVRAYFMDLQAILKQHLSKEAPRLLRCVSYMELDRLQLLKSARDTVVVWKAFADKLGLHACPQQFSSVDALIKESRLFFMWIVKHRENIQKLDQLSLSGRQLEWLPADLPLYSKLEILHLDHNRFRFIPDQLQRVRSLRILNLRHNLIPDSPTWENHFYLWLVDLTGNPSSGGMTYIKTNEEIEYEIFS